jgi:type III pantothenate kinase
MKRRLLLDAGNSSLKWALVADGQWCVQGRSRYDELSGVQQLLTADTECFIASVANASCERELAALLHAADIPAVWLTAEAVFGALRNTYRNPHQLGVDRWMSLIAARQRSQEAVLVVSAGTAMTVDAVSAAGAFIGGIIVPGVVLMRQSLLQGTAGVAEVAGQCQAFPRSTADAVESGIVAALCGAIRQQYAHLAEIAGTAPRCLLTGGDSDLLLPHLGLPAELVPALVLEGIDCVSRGRMS